MTMHVHWHEGLFLQPHHLQMMQRGLHGLVQDQRRLSWHYPYGLIEARLLENELENGRVRFEKLHVILPSGLEIKVPDNAVLPSLDIKAELAASSGKLNIHLGVPLWAGHQANAFRAGPDMDPRLKIRYQIEEMDSADENTGKNSKLVTVRKINARLVLDKDGFDSLEALPLLRIQRATDNQKEQPRVDAAFVPPCLVLSASPTLLRFMTELAAKLESTRDELAQKLGRSDQPADGKGSLMFLLRTLGRNAGCLVSLTRSAKTTPFEFYLKLQELLGELAALQPGQEDFTCAPYNHDNPFFCFQELDAKIRRLLVFKADEVWKEPFVRGGSPIRPRLVFKDEHLGLDSKKPAPEGYYLGIRTQHPRTTLVNYVKERSKFKLMPASLEDSAIFGVELHEESIPPSGMPGGLYYFRLSLRENRHWPTMVENKAAVLVFTSPDLDLSDTDFTLFMTLPSNKS